MIVPLLLSDHSFPNRGTKPYHQGFKFKFIKSLINTTSRFSLKIPSMISHKLLFSPRRRQFSIEDEKIMNQADIDVIELMDQDIPIYKWGKGKRIILVHGWWGNGLQLKNFIQPLILSGFEVIAFDAPGHGNSKPQDCDVVKFANSLLHVYEHYKSIEGIVAYSFGGTATLLAMYNGLKSKKSVFLGSPVSTNQIVTRFTNMLNLNEKLTEELYLMTNQSLKTSLYDKDNILFKSRSIMNDFDSCNMCDIMSAVSPISYLHSLSSDFLIFHDLQDDFVPFSDGYNFFRNLINAEILATYGFGHRDLIRKNEIINRVSDYFSGNIIIH